MTPTQHYREAERLLVLAVQAPTPQECLAWATAAQAHAQLAAIAVPAGGRP